MPSGCTLKSMIGMSQCTCTNATVFTVGQIKHSYIVHVIKIILRYKAEHVSSPTYTANRLISHSYKALGNGKKKFNLNAISVVSFPYASLPS